MYRALRHSNNLYAFKAPKPSRFPFETISYDDPNWFRIEAGPIQTSIYGQHIEIPKCRIDQYVWENFDQWQNKTAVTCRTSGKSFTYGRLRDKCANFAVNLQKFGLKQSDVVGVCMSNGPEFIIAAMGTFEAGCKLTLINSVDVSKQIHAAGVKLLICTPDYFELLQSAVEMSKKDIKIVCTRMSQSDSFPNGVIDFHEWDEGSSNGQLKTDDKDSSDDIGFIPFTSDGKAVMLSHKNVIANSEMVEINTNPLTRKTTTVDQETILCAQSITATTFIQNLISKLRIGSKILTFARYTPDTLVEAIHRHQVTTAGLPSSMITILAQSNNIKSHHLISLRRILCKPALLRDEDVDKVHTKVPNVVFTQTYGKPEVPVVLVSNVVENERAPQGFPMAGTQVKVVAVDDPEMKALDVGCKGELLVRGPHIMEGYLNDEMATKKVLMAHGKWFRTGDVGHYDEKGKLFVMGRCRD